MKEWSFFDWLLHKSLQFSFKTVYKIMALEIGDFYGGQDGGSKL